MEKITIDGVAYSIATLSDQSKELLGMLAIADSKIKSLQQDLALAQTARTAYANALKGSLPTSAQTFANQDSIPVSQL